MEILLPSVSPSTQASGLQEARGRHVAAPLSFSCYKHSLRHQISTEDTSTHTYTPHRLTASRATKPLRHALKTDPSARPHWGGFFPPHRAPISPPSPSWHPEPLPRGRGRALGHPLSCFCLVHTAGCQKGPSSGTASLESLRQLSSRHSSEHTYATLSQLSSSRVKHDSPAAPRASPASLTLPSPKRASPKGAGPGGPARACGRSRPVIRTEDVPVGWSCQFLGSKVLREGWEWSRFPCRHPRSMPWVSPHKAALAQAPLLRASDAEAH